MRQFRFAPLKLGDDRGFLVVHSNCGNIDPYPPYFRLPTDTLKLTVFSSKGKLIWNRDLGPGVIPGIWFCPVVPFDLDGDGTDEIYVVNNSRPEHPMDPTGYVLERVLSETGKVTASRPFPHLPLGTAMSHLYRNFINAGFNKNQRLLITAQGTYGAMKLQAWNSSLRTVWSREIPSDAPGARGSHMFPVLDIDSDGRDELLWGERCLDIETGKEIWIADEEGWNGHSDLVMPTLDRKTARWFIYTCREQPAHRGAVGVVMFDNKGKEVWGYRGMGHVHNGWTARLKDDGSHICYALDIGRRKGSKSDVYIYDMQGKAVELPFRPRGTPVDFDGDGLHELMMGGRRGADARVIDREGRLLYRIQGDPKYGGNILDLPGEQIVTWSQDGTVRIYACPNAKDTPAAKARYEHPYYQSCLRIWAMGYNVRNLGGL